MDEITNISTEATIRYFTTLSQFGYKNNNDINKLLVLLLIEELLTSELKNKLNSVIEIILKEIQTNKNVNEKLYILSVILRNNKIEIDQLITDYLRTMQTKYID